jgi:hypothetical protein
MSKRSKTRPRIGLLILAALVVVALVRFLPRRLPSISMAILINLRFRRCT